MVTSMPSRRAEIPRSRVCAPRWESVRPRSIPHRVCRLRCWFPSWEGAVPLMGLLATSRLPRAGRTVTPCASKRGATTLGVPENGTRDGLFRSDPGSRGPAQSLRKARTGWSDPWRSTRTRWQGAPVRIRRVVSSGRPDAQLVRKEGAPPRPKAPMERIRTR